MSCRARGVLYVHSAPPALCRHIEWAAANVLGQELRFDWIAQSAAPNTLRADVRWTGVAGAGAQLASALRGWEHLRFEVTEDATAEHEGRRYMHTPSLGLFSSYMDAHGNMLLQETTVREVLLRNGSVDEIRAAFSLAMGQAWDDELEPFRYGASAVGW